MLLSATVTGVRAWCGAAACQTAWKRLLTKDPSGAVDGDLQLFGASGQLADRVERDQRAVVPAVHGDVRARGVQPHLEVGGGAQAARAAGLFERAVQPGHRLQVALQHRAQLVGTAQFQVALLGGHRGGVDQQDSDGHPARHGFAHHRLEALRVRLGEQVGVGVQDPDHAGRAAGVAQELGVVQFGVLPDAALPGALDDRGDDVDGEDRADQVRGGVQREVRPVRRDGTADPAQREDRGQTDDQTGDPAWVRRAAAEQPQQCPVPPDQGYASHGAEGYR